MTTNAVLILVLIWLAVVGLGYLYGSASKTSLTARSLGRLENLGNGPVNDTGNAAVANLAMPAWWSKAHAQLGLRGSAVATWKCVVGAAGGVAGALAWQSPVLFAALLAVTGVALLLGWRWREVLSKRRAPNMGERTDAISARLAAGFSPTAAVASVFDMDDPSTEELRADLGRGNALQPSLDRWAASSAEPGARLMADAFAVADSSGAAIGAALERVAQTLRDREALQGEIVALGAQARMSAKVLTAVPLGFATLSAVVDHRVAAFTFGSVAGWLCLISGLALNAIGALWMRHLIGALS